MIENRSYNGPLWHVAYVEPRVERELVGTIKDELGFEAYTPLEQYRATIRGRRVDACRPVFPRYVFVACDPYKDEWQRLLDVDGVVDVLRNDNIPGYVPASWIMAIRKAEEAGVFDRIRPNASKFKIGETVRVSEGPFSGFHALIQEFIAKMRSTTASKRAKVLVAFMGRMSAIEMDVTALEKL